MRQEEIKVEVVEVDELIQDDKNFNKGTEQGQQLIERSFRECGAGRSVFIDKDNRLVGGNKAQKGFKAAGKKRVVIVESDPDTLVAVRRKDVSLDSAEGRRMALLDNLTTQVNIAWDPSEIEAVSSEIDGFDPSDYGFDPSQLEVAGMGDEKSEGDRAKEEVKKRTQWGKAKDYEEPVCNMVDTIEIHALRGYKYVHSFKTGSTEGTPISELKKPENAYMFALKAKELITATIGLKQTKGWCIITTPKRRHKEKNFASLVCEQLSQMLGIPFHEDVVEAKNRARIDPVFTLVKEVEEPNIIIYDDILTGGTTLYTTANLFPTKNLFLVVGINNHR